MLHIYGYRNLMPAKFDRLMTESTTGRYCYE